jgi:multisubunit Na+/H+ antiporter MnhF subunit
MDLADMAVPIVGPCEPTATVGTDIIPLVVVGFLVVYSHILSASTLRTID